MFASITTVVPGQNGFTTITTAQHNLNPDTTYWVCSCVQNALNTIPVCSKRVRAQTTAAPVIYTLAFDSGYATGEDTYDLPNHAVVPAGDLGYRHVLIAPYPTLLPVTVLPDLPDAHTGITNNVINLSGLIAGQKYAVTIYGNDTISGPTRRFYSAWDVIDTFTFSPLIMTGVHDVFDLDKSSSLNIYPNPVTDESTIFISDPQGVTYEILDELGRVAASFPASGNETRLLKRNLVKGFYTLVARSDQKTLQKKIIIE